MDHGMTADEAYEIIDRHYYGHFNLVSFSYHFEELNRFANEPTKKICVEQFETLCLTMHLQYDNRKFGLLNDYYIFATQFYPPGSFLRPRLGSHTGTDDSQFWTLPPDARVG